MGSRAGPIPEARTLFAPAPDRQLAGKEPRALFPGNLSPASDRRVPPTDSSPSTVGASQATHEALAR
jgi:hypothetical protein